MLDMPRWLEQKIMPEPNSGCWLWMGALNKGGYGGLALGRHKNKMPHSVQAHRLVYEYYKGPIPEKLVLDHLCRVRCCVNPDHLEPVTHQINTLRGNGFAAENAKKVACKHGHSLIDAYISKKGSRECRTCKAIGWRNWYNRKKTMKKVTPELLIEEILKLSDWISQQQKRFDDYMKPHRENVDMLKNDLQAVLVEMGLTSIKSQEGTAYLSTITTPSIDGDKTAFLDWCLSSWDERGAMLQIGAPQKAAVQEYMDSHGGELPPYIKTSSITRVNIRRS